VAKLLPEAVKNVGSKPPLHVAPGAGRDGWEPPLIEPPEAIAM